MEITVIGRHVTRHDPEIGRLRLEASRSGPDAAQVYDETAEAVQTLTADLRRLEEEGALEEWSVHPVTTSSWFEAPLHATMVASPVGSATMHAR